MAITDGPGGYPPHCSATDLEAPVGGTCGVPAGSTAGPTSFFSSPYTNVLYCQFFCISFSLSFTFASVPASVILNNRYPARGVYRGVARGVARGEGHPPCRHTMTFSLNQWPLFPGPCGSSRGRCPEGSPSRSPRFSVREKQDEFFL